MKRKKQTDRDTIITRNKIKRDSKPDLEPCFDTKWCEPIMGTLIDLLRDPTIKIEYLLKKVKFKFELIVNLWPNAYKETQTTNILTSEPETQRLYRDANHRYS